MGPPVLLQFLVAPGRQALPPAAAEQVLLRAQAPLLELMEKPREFAPQRAAARASGSRRRAALQELQPGAAAADEARKQQPSEQEERRQPAGLLPGQPEACLLSPAPLVAEPQYSPEDEAEERSCVAPAQRPERSVAVCSPPQSRLERCPVAEGQLAERLAAKPLAAEPRPGALPREEPPSQLPRPACAPGSP